MSTRREFITLASAGVMAASNVSAAAASDVQDANAKTPAGQGRERSAVRGGGEKNASLVISGATVIDGVAEQALEGRSIWIEKGRIKAIARPESLGAPRSVKTIDARGKYVMPGLMDANVHLLLDTQLETLVRYEDQYEELIIEAAQVALKNGLTTVFDSWGPRKPLMAARDRINAGTAIGSRVFCAGNIIGLDGPYSADFRLQPLDVASNALALRINSLWVENTGPDLSWMTPDQVAEEIRSYIGKGIDFIKYASNEHRGAEPSTFLLFSPLVQQRMIGEAHHAGITAQAHTSSVEGLRVAVEAGCDLIQHANVTGPVPIPETTLQLMAQRKTAAVIFPFTQRRFDMIMEKGDPLLRRYFSTSDVNCRAFLRSGVTLLLGTDAGLHPAQPQSPTTAKKRWNWTADGDDNLTELGQGHFNWLKAMEEKGYPAMAALKGATRNIAAAYGKDKDLGTLEPGKIADLLILDKNPLQAAANYRSIHAVIKDGAVVDRNPLPLRPMLTRPAAPLPDTTANYGKYSISRFPPVDRE